MGLVEDNLLERKSDSSFIFDTINHRICYGMTTLFQPAFDPNLLMGAEAFCKSWNAALVMGMSHAHRFWSHSVTRGPTESKIEFSTPPRMIKRATT
jgi:hypothetical protein